MKNVIGLALAICVSTAAFAQDGDIGQTYTYELTDRAAFEQGYRKHLEWHAARQDTLVWYAWYVSAGDRIGTFIDGTFGVTLAQLDARPDLPGDGADFRKNAAAFAKPLATQTWQRLGALSTVSPLEARKPPAELDVFLVEVSPEKGAAFEDALKRMATGGGANPALMTVYRLVRGGAMPSYLFVTGRSDWSGLSRAGLSFGELLALAYGRDALSAVALAKSIRSETWSYAPRLALIPGQPLTP